MYIFTPDWECVSKESTIADNFSNNKLLVISEILTGDDIILIEFEQVVKFPLKNIPPLDQCSYCAKQQEEESEGKLPRCTKCFRSAYCNSECQLKDWNRHSTTLCCKPSDSVGIPVLVSLQKSQMNSWVTLKSILSEVSSYSIETNSESLDISKKMQFYLLNRSSGKMEVIESLESILNLNTHGKQFPRIQLKWNNNANATTILQIKTSINQINFVDEPTSPNTVVTLNDCLKLFTQPEKLTSDNPWFCSKCKKHQEATKQMNIWRLPKYLIVTLKRFQANKVNDNFSNMSSEDPTYKYLMMNTRISSFLQNRVVYNKLNTDVKFPMR